MSLPAGTKLGPYDVVSALGAGGMGEVYRATDTKLGRSVAIKILPDAFTSDPDRVARFEREARVLASLNHPHIAAIYGVEEFERAGALPVKALIMEFVEGATLADLIVGESRHSPLRIDRALRLAQQIAEALEAAHEKGIVHRDLKPSNVKVTSDDNVKLLDFGLAKALASDADVDVSNSPTLTAMATHAGVIMGTAAYMSPEQAKGGAVDRRTDIFAFGCLLYEMLTGRRAFEGDSVSEIVARVIEREPDWSALPTTLHPRISELLRRCLEKDPKRRRRDIGDVRMEIEHVLSGPVQTVPPAVDGAFGHRARLAWIVASVLSVALAVAIARPYFSTPAAAPETRVDVSTPETPAPTSFAISPDGRRLAFVAFRSGQAQLYVRSLDADAAQPLSGTEGAAQPFWSPDGRSIGFFTTGQLKRIDIEGGLVQRLAQAVPGSGGTWGPDGTILFAPTQTGTLFRVPASGGEPVGVTKVTKIGARSAHVFPSFLPGGRQFLFYVPGPVDVRGIYLGSLDSPETTRIIDADTPGAYVPSGWLLFARQGALVARRFDPARREISGDPVTVAESVAIGGRGGFSVSATGVIAYRTGETSPRQLTWFDRSGRAVGTLGEPDRANLLNPELSRDGRRAAVNRRVQNNGEAWLIDAGRTTRFTFDGALYPVWSPDGDRIAFAGSTADLYQRVTSGAGSDELLLTSPQLKFPSDWSADGRSLMYFVINTTASPDLWVLPMDGDRKPFVFLGTNFSETWGQFSPDGQWVAYQSNESGRFEIYVRPFPGPGGQWPASTSGGIYPRWSPDGKEVFYVSPTGGLMATSIVVHGAAIEAGTPVPLFQPRIVGGGAFLPGFRPQYDVAPDGRFLINVETESTSPPITLVLNWKPPVQ